MRILAVIAALGLQTYGAAAEDAALLLGTERYRQLDRVVFGAEVVDAARPLARAGYAVSALGNGAGATTQTTIDDFVGNTADADRLVVALSGRFVTDSDRNWFLTADAPTPSLMGLGDTAVSLESLLALLGQRQGKAVLVLGYDAGDQTSYDGFLRAGIEGLDVPQGVMVVIGEPRAAGDFVADQIAVAGTDIARAAQSSRRLDVAGYQPDTLIFTPAGAVDVPVASATDPDAEAALWAGAQALDSIDAYQNYLNRYPDGVNATDAERLIAEIQSEPNRAARLAEDGLSLNRDARRDIQRDLTILNFNPRGIDGIFGPGTRSAIANWQQQTGFSQTSYLNAELINRLDAQAARRAAELEAEAQRAREAALRLDRAYWQETGARGDEPGFRAYLERYPDGAFAKAANDALAKIADDKRALAAAEDSRAWDQAKRANTVEAYRAYRQLFPEGAFVAEADAQIAALRAPRNANAVAALAGEAALGLDGITLRLIEARLSQLGLEPGDVDGRFDDDSRRSLRRFQRDRSLDVTGFLNDETIVRLLADGFKLIGR